MGPAGDVHEKCELGHFTKSRLKLLSCVVCPEILVKWGRKEEKISDESDNVIYIGFIDWTFLIFPRHHLMTVSVMGRGFCVHFLFSLFFSI